MSEVISKPGDFKTKGVEWTPKSCGWDCRVVKYVEKVRRRRWLGHLGKAVWLEMQTRPDLAAAVAEWIEAKKSAKGITSAQVQVRACRVCGCTDNDCSGCVVRTGMACWWIEADLCSACGS
jgi:hypothetical protein